MRVLATLFTASVIVISSGFAQAAAKPRVSVAQLQAQLKKVSAERDDLKDRLAAAESLQEDLAAAQKSRDMARQETNAIQKELDQMKSALAENQSGADAILKELQQAKEDLAAAQASNETLRAAAAEAKEKQASPIAEGALVPITPDIIPARALNLNRVLPKVRHVSRGVVVVNVLVSEAGDVLDSRLLQGLPGTGEWYDKANAACVDAAKRIVFDPARAADGKTKVRVWQGVGFLVD